MVRHPWLPHFIERTSAAARSGPGPCPSSSSPTWYSASALLDLEDWSSARSSPPPFVIAALVGRGWWPTGYGASRCCPTARDRLAELVMFVVVQAIPSSSSASTAMRRSRRRWRWSCSRSTSGHQLRRGADVALGRAGGRVTQLLCSPTSSWALPLLLLFTAFLFINAEVWQVAGTLDRPAYGSCSPSSSPSAPVRAVPVPRSCNASPVRLWGEIGLPGRVTPATTVRSAARPWHRYRWRSVEHRQRFNIGLVTSSARPCRSRSWSFRSSGSSSCSASSPSPSTVAAGRDSRI